MSGAFPDGRSVPGAHRNPSRPRRQPLPQGRRAERGLITLEWLLIVGAVAGLAASSVLIVQRVVDDQSEVPDDPLVRMLEADIAAAAVAADAQAIFDDNPTAYVHLHFANRCRGVGVDFRDVVDGAPIWVGPAGPDLIQGNADDGTRCIVKPRRGLGT